MSKYDDDGEDSEGVKTISDEEEEERDTISRSVCGSIVKIEVSMFNFMVEAQVPGKD